MTKATRILNKYHIKNMLLSGETQFENFYKEELIQFCKVAKAEIEQASKEKQELMNYLKNYKLTQEIKEQQKEFICGYEYAMKEILSKLVKITK